MTIQYLDSKRIQGIRGEEYYEETDANSGASMSNGGVYYAYGTEIRAGNSAIGKQANKWTIQFGRNNSPQGVVEAHIYTGTEGATSKTHSQTSTNSVTVDNISTSNLDYSFTFATPHTISAGDVIALVWKTDTSTSSSNYVNVRLFNALTDMPNTRNYMVSTANWDGSDDDSHTWSVAPSPYTTYTLTSKLELTDDKPLDVQDNSLFIETDTARRYWFRAPTITFDYSDTVGWTFTNSAITNTGGECVMTSGDASNDVRGYKSLGTTLSDTIWTADFEFEHSDESPRAAGMPFCITAGTGIPASATQDMLGVKTFTSSNVIFPMYKDGSGSVTTGSTITLTFGTKYYCRLSRTTATNLELKVFSDSSRSTQVGSTINLTIPSTITTLTTLQHAISPGSSGDKMNFKIDNTKIYNGTTSVAPAAWTMQPTYEDDFSTDKGWTTVGTGSNGNISITGGELFIDTVVGNSDTRVYKALGFTLSDNWTARWEQTMKGTTDNNVYMQVMNFTAGNSNLNAGTSQDSVHMITDSGAQTIYVRSKDGSSAGNQSSGQALTTNTKYYMEFVKDGTGLTLRIRTGSHSGTLVNTLTTTCTSGVTGLTHIQTGGATGTNSGAASYSFDNIEIYNGVTSIN